MRITPRDDSPGGLAVPQATVVVLGYGSIGDPWGACRPSGAYLPPPEAPEGRGGPETKPQGVVVRRVSLAPGARLTDPEVGAGQDLPGVLLGLRLRGLRLCRDVLRGLVLRPGVLLLVLRLQDGVSEPAPLEAAGEDSRVDHLVQLGQLGS